MLVCTDNSRIQLEFLQIILAECGNNALPDASRAPAIEAGVDGVPFAEALGGIAPGDGGFLDKENGINEEAVVLGSDAAVFGFAGQEFFDALILRIAQRVSWCGHRFSYKYH